MKFGLDSWCTRWYRRQRCSSKASMMNRKYCQRQKEYALDIKQKCSKTNTDLSKTNMSTTDKFIPQPTLVLTLKCNSDHAAPTTKTLGGCPWLTDPLRASFQPQTKKVLIKLSVCLLSRTLHSSYSGPAAISQIQPVLSYSCHSARLGGSACRAPTSPPGFSLYLALLPILRPHVVPSLTSCSPLIQIMPLLYLP